MPLFPERVDYGGLEGMTVNERLSTMGTRGQFDLAVRQLDRARMIGLLTAVKIGPDDAIAIADAILADPARYGHV